MNASKHRKTITRKVVSKAIENYSGLFFGEYNSIDLDAAELLVHEVSDLHLDGLTSLDEGLAEILSRHRGMLLSLNGIKDLQPAVATAVSEYRGLLLLNGMEQLTPEIAQPLASHIGGVVLNGVRNIDEQSAACFACKHESLSLDGLTDISPAIARHLIDPGDTDDIDPEKDGLAAAMQSLIGRRSLSLSALVSLDPDVAFVFTQHKGMLILNGIQSIDRETAQILSSSKATLLALDGLSHIDSDAEQTLRTFNGTLYLGTDDDEDEL